MYNDNKKNRMNKKINLKMIINKANSYEFQNQTIWYILQNLPYSFILFI